MVKVSVRLGRHTAWVATLGWFALSAAGCPGLSDAGGGSADCTPGALSPCRCGLLETGSQLCAPDGKSFGQCECSAANGGAGNGQAAGMTAGTSSTGVAGATAGMTATAGTVAGTGAAGVDGLAGTGAAGTSADLDAGLSGNDNDASTAGNPEAGRLAGITAAHNAVRANVSTPTPSTPIPPLTWSESLAATAQAYAEKLATTGNCQLVHSGASGLGENIAYYGGSMASAEDAVDGWSSEVACWTYGQFMKTDSCDMTCTTNLHSNGCGHYTQVVWRNTTQVGCGVATCAASGGFSHREIWVCNYTAQGNFIGQNPY